MRGLVFFCFLAHAFAYSMTDPKEFERIAAVVNAASVSWTADPTASGRFTSLSHAKMLCGTYRKGHPRWANANARFREYSGTSNVSTPASFDPRTKWPKCTVISKVRNQAGCGSCWAFGATESFEGSRCAVTGEDIEYSADDTAACSALFGSGCEGGEPAYALEWMTQAGVVTGGEYGEDNGCLPYVCPPCEKGLYPPDCPTDQCESKLKCTKKCSNPSYSKSYSADKTKASDVFTFRISSGPPVEKMQNALMTTGPLSAGFTVYDDFPTYKSGVYSHTTGGQLGGHAIVILGWGAEGSDEHWLCKNSWSAKWGDKGFFKIARGVDECGIEEDVAGVTFNTAVVV